MKRIVLVLCLISSLILCASCQSQGDENPVGKEGDTVKTVQAAISESTESSDTTVHQHNHLSHNETKAEQDSSNGDLVNYMGECIVDKNDFEIFEKYFYGKWIDESGTAPENVELYYSGSTFSLGFYTLSDIYTDENSAYLVTTVVGETTIYVIDFDAPETMYEYYETNHGGRPKNQPDFIYTKTSVSEEDSLGFFGILKLHYVDDIPIEVLTGNTLELADGSKWRNFGEKISVVEKDTDKITIRALCRAEGYDPYIIGVSEELMESKEIVYTVSYIEKEWIISGCEYAMA